MSKVRILITASSFLFSIISPISAQYETVLQPSVTVEHSRSYDSMIMSGVGTMSAQWSLDETRVLSWHPWGNALIWNSTTGEILYDLTKPNDASMQEARWSPDERRVVILTYVYCNDNHPECPSAIRVWNLEPYSFLDVARIRGEQDYRSVLWSGDSQSFLAIGGGDGSRLYDAVTGEVLIRTNLNQAAWSPDYQYIIAYDQLTLEIWNAVSRSLVGNYHLRDTASGYNVNILSWSADNHLFVTREANCSDWSISTYGECFSILRTWDVTSVLPINRQAYRNVTLSYLAGSGGSISYWYEWVPNQQAYLSTEDGSRIELTTRDGLDYSPRLSPDRESILLIKGTRNNHSCCYGDTSLWTTQGQQVWTRSFATYEVAFSPNSSFISIYGDAGERNRFRRQSLIFARDGSILAQLALYIDVNGQEHVPGNSGFVWNSTSTRLISLDDYGVVQVWDIDQVAN